jgi:prepilin-type N-terminal cleavage/methylation domain-containing protein
MKVKLKAHILFLKGFTLVEMLVVLAITSVITILAYYLFMGLFRQNTSNTKVQELTRKLLVTENTIHTHFEQAAYGKMIDEQTLFLLTKTDTSRFTLDQSYILFHHATGADTIIAGQLRYTKKYIPELASQQILQELLITFKDTIGIQQQWRFTLDNSARVLMYLDSIYNKR